MTETRDRPATQRNIDPEVLRKAEAVIGQWERGEVEMTARELAIAILSVGSDLEGDPERRGMKG